MSVAAVKEYVGVPRDVVANYHGNQLVYVIWEQHLMYAAPFILPVPPSMKFIDLLTQVVGGIIKDHPDTPKIDWRKTEWTKGYQPWTPDFDKTLAENSIIHKDILKFRTPGLTGYKGLGI